MLLTTEPMSDIPYMIGLTPEIVMETALPRGNDMEDLAEHIKGTFPGILEQLARTYVNETAEPLLAEVLAMADNRAAVTDPRTFFGIDDESLAITRCIAHFASVITANSPLYMGRAMTALVELGLGHFATACRQAAFALCLKQNPNFDEFIHSRHDLVQDILVATERRKAEILIALINKARLSA